jgi:hypothetical protein
MLKAMEQVERVEQVEMGKTFSVEFWEGLYP